MMIFLEPALQVFAAIAFGHVLGLGELLERRGYRWFRGAPLALGVAGGVLGVLMLLLSTAGVHHFWLAALTSWVFLGQVRHRGRAVMAAILVLYLGVWTAGLDNLDTRALAGLLAGLMGVGVLQRLLKRARPKLPDTVVEERWAWYAVVAGYLFLVEMDLGFACAVWAFQSGRTDVNASKLRSWGVKPPLSAPD
ncbi:MAG: hypothetical protein RLO52_11400 [Sandaracinaceae bacterium]|mgnify:CR=1 FL=1|nr:MAG: hypothetical protein EVA89_24245 [Sandaracinaceae bacterium]